MLIAYFIIGIIVSAALVGIVCIVDGKNRKSYYQDIRFWTDMAWCAVIWPLIVVYVVLTLVGRLMYFWEKELY